MVEEVIALGFTSRRATKILSLPVSSRTVTGCESSVPEHVRISARGPAPAVAQMAGVSSKVFADPGIGVGLFTGTSSSQDTEAAFSGRTLTAFAFRGTAAPFEGWRQLAASRGGRRSFRSSGWRCQHSSEEWAAEAPWNEHPPEVAGLPVPRDVGAGALGRRTRLPLGRGPPPATGGPVGATGLTGRGTGVMTPTGPPRPGGGARPPEPEGGLEMAPAPGFRLGVPLGGPPGLFAAH